MKYLFILFFIPSVYAVEFEASQYSFVRIFEKAAKDPDWQQMDVRQKILWVRKRALKQKTVSDPVSDRYTLTAYGGPIDLVHFLMLASEALRDGVNMNERLYKEWKQEGGLIHLRGFNPSYPSEAHPDDLPSNALGALFGREIKQKLKNKKLDLLLEFKAFVKPLKLLPDSFAKKFSHRRSVMGLRLKEDSNLEISRYIWFTAAPLNLTQFYNSEYRKLHKKPFCKVLKSGRSCLSKAGFRLKNYRGVSIIIDRL